MAVTDVGIDVTPTQVVNIPPDVEIPPAPETVRRPAQPVISTVLLPETLTIARNTDIVAGPDLPPRPKAPDASTLADGPRFVVTTVKPKMLNDDEVQRVLQREYPALLRDAGGALLFGREKRPAHGERE